MELLKPVINCVCVPSFGCSMARAISNALFAGELFTSVCNSASALLQLRCCTVQLFSLQLLDVTTTGEGFWNFRESYITKFMAIISFRDDLSNWKFHFRLEFDRSCRLKFSSYKLICRYFKKNIWD